MIKRADQERKRKIAAVIIVLVLDIALIFAIIILLNADLDAERYREDASYVSVMQLDCEEMVAAYQKVLAMNPQNMATNLGIWYIYSIHSYLEDASAENAEDVPANRSERQNEIVSNVEEDAERVEVIEAEGVEAIPDEIDENDKDGKDSYMPVYAKLLADFLYDTSGDIGTYGSFDFTPASDGGNFAFADLDGDGREELLVGRGNKFAPWQVLIPGEDWTHSAVGFMTDYDQDTGICLCRTSMLEGEIIDMYRFQEDSMQYIGGWDLYDYSDTPENFYKLDADGNYIECSKEDLEAIGNVKIGGIEINGSPLREINVFYEITKTNIETYCGCEIPEPFWMDDIVREDGMPYAEGMRIEGIVEERFNAADDETVGYDYNYYVLCLDEPEVFLLEDWESEKFVESRKLDEIAINLSWGEKYCGRRISAHIRFATYTVQGEELLGLDEIVIIE